MVLRFDDKKVILGLLLAVTVILAAFIARDIIRSQKEKQTDFVPIIIEEPVKTQDAASEEKAVEEDNDPFRQEAPVITRIPEANEVIPESQREEIAIPTVVVPAAPGVESSFRNFNISAEGGKFIPEKIIVKVGDTVHVNFTAVDSDYDIVFPSYNMKQIAKKGQTKVLEFQALQDGSFTYYCEACGGPEGPTTGSFIIVK